MRTNVWLALSLAVLTQPLLANGGGYLRGGVEKAGDLTGFEPQQTEKIRILDEKLTVKLGPHEADVEVRYLMRNETDKKVKVRFGFPVEESFDNDFSGQAEKDRPKNPSPRYCQDYVITAGGKPVSVKWQAEENREEDKRLKGIEGWLISDLYSFLTGEPATYNIDALEDSELLLISKTAHEELLQKVPEYETYTRLQLTGAYLAMQRRLTS
ncbi:MAG: DUF4424 domain-containing protein, partial [Verrucomicrobiaceae bacterium]